MEKASEFPVFLFLFPGVVLFRLRFIRGHSNAPLVGPVFHAPKQGARASARFPVGRLFAAEPAVFLELEPVRIVLLVLVRVVVALFALLACEGDFVASASLSHDGRPP